MLFTPTAPGTCTVSWIFDSVPGTCTAMVCPHGLNRPGDCFSCNKKNFCVHCRKRKRRCVLLVSRAPLNAVNITRTQGVCRPIQQSTERQAAERQEAERVAAERVAAERQEAANWGQIGPNNRGKILATIWQQSRLNLNSDHYDADFTKRFTRGDLEAVQAHVLDQQNRLSTLIQASMVTRGGEARQQASGGTVEQGGSIDLEELRESAVVHEYILAVRRNKRQNFYFETKGLKLELHTDTIKSLRAPGSFIDGEVFQFSMGLVWSPHNRPLCWGPCPVPSNVLNEFYIGDDSALLALMTEWEYEPDQLKWKSKLECRGHGKRFWILPINCCAGAHYALIIIVFPRGPSLHKVHMLWLDSLESVHDDVKVTARTHFDMLAHHIGQHQQRPHLEVFGALMQVPQQSTSRWHTNNCVLHMVEHGTRFVCCKESREAIVSNLTMVEEMASGGTDTCGDYTLYMCDKKCVFDGWNNIDISFDKTCRKNLLYKVDDIVNEFI